VLNVADDTSAGPGVASHLGLTEAECDFLAKSVSAHKEEFVHAFAQDGEIMKIVQRLKPEWKDPLLFKRQLLRSNIPNVSGATRLPTQSSM
jgi:phytanoyl-CoA hydroxylase